ncbi:general stress protein 26 [Paenibacillus rhizosphaerae]|uniref:General stress protein 26 n=1 Tax=Paenibacillus rhizosphaerae TaxID=297318 RepID=A0A839TUI3_9BACL|nr:pyridoxamine 5'-phosphate oxidase family protein [Paenibacillus rhizosphaerae]MBB3130362.1 general stress protein 26 [Paenibacillus rhizosphaerae]
MEAKFAMEHEVAKILDHHEYAAVATVENQKPRLRRMPKYNKGLSIYLVADRKSLIWDLESKTPVSLLVGHEENDSREAVEIDGKLTVNTEEALRRQIWREEFSKDFSGPDDPDYVILQVKAIRVEYADKDGQKHEWFDY